MRADYFAVGVIALLIGFMVFMLFYSEVKEHETWAGELARALAPKQKKNTRIEKFIMISGGVIAIIGIASMIYGIAAPSEKGQKT